MLERPIHLAPKLSLPATAITETFAIVGKRGMGKALALDTPIPTVDGWTTMGEIRLGEAIFDDAGRPCRVIGVFDVQRDRRCYRVTFSDGSSIVADAEHLWRTESLASRRADGQRKLRVSRGRGLGGHGGRWQCQRRVFPAVVTTEEMRASLHVPVGGRLDRNHAIANCRPIQCPDLPLPIDPYVLGAWLGDGTSTSANITTRVPVGFAGGISPENVDALLDVIKSREAGAPSWIDMESGVRDADDKLSLDRVGEVLERVARVNAEGRG